MGVHFRSNLKLMIHDKELFDSLIKPILLYGSEVWGIETKEPDSKNPIEAVHIKFCKLLLGTSRFSANIACKGELGRFSLNQEATYRSLKYWTKLIDSKTSNLTRQSYLECLKLNKQES